jgi:hypothetical protein
MATAFLWPTSTTSLLPLVMPVSTSTVGALAQGAFYRPTKEERASLCWLRSLAVSYSDTFQSLWCSGYPQPFWLPD